MIRDYHDSTAPAFLQPFQRVARRLGLTWRGAIEFGILAAVLALAEPTVASLAVGGVISFIGELLRIVTSGYGYSVGELSLRGPYRFVRHPHFLGSALLYFGLCVASRNPYVMGVALVAMAGHYRFAVRADEKRLLHRLGPRFAEYRARVPAFLPQLWPLAAEPDNKSFSLNYALFAGRHREFNAVLGSAVAFALLYLSYKLAAKDVFQLVVLITVGLYIIGRFIYYGLVKKPAR